MRTRLFSAVPLILATITTLACGQGPTAPETGTTPIPKASELNDPYYGYPTWPPPSPPHADGVSLAAVEVSAVTVPPPTLFPWQNTDLFHYSPTLALRETGGVYGATFESIQFGINGNDPAKNTLYFGAKLARIAAGSQWEFRTPDWADTDEPVSQPLTDLVVRVNFLGDDGKLGTAEGTWTADAASQP